MTTKSTKDAKDSKKSYPKKGTFEVKEIYLKPLEPKEAEPVVVDGTEFLIFLVEDKNHVEVDKYDMILMEDGVRVDCVGGVMRVYPKMGSSTLVYDRDRHAVRSKSRGAGKGAEKSK